MCTLIVLNRPGHPWPMLFAANRDEMVDRPWQPPARHWPDRSNVVAGLDELAGGSWLGLNDDGLVAGVMNRRGALGPAAGKRSRGELVLEALDHADAATAADALAGLDPAAYRAFNLVIADARRAFWLRHTETDHARGVEVMELAAGISMLTAFDCNDPGSARIRRYLPRFRAAPAPIPETDDWSAWQTLLASEQTDAGPEGAMNLRSDRGFGTVSSSLLALPGPDRFGVRPRFRFAAGPPGVAPYREVTL